MQFDNQIQTLTQDYIAPKIVDQTKGSNVLNILLFKQAKAWLGETYKVPVQLRDYANGGSFTDFDEFTIGGEDVRQNAEYLPKAYYFSVGLGGLAMTFNGISKTQLLNLVKVEMEGVKQQMASNMGTVGYSDGTGNGGKDFDGVRAMVDDGLSVQTYGNIDRSVETAWVSQVETSSGAFDFTKARTLMNNASLGSLKPNVIVGDEATFGYAEADYVQNVQYNIPAMESARGTLGKDGITTERRAGLIGNQGFDLLYFAGTPLVKDEKQGSGTLDALNLDYINFVGAKQIAMASMVDMTALYTEGNDYSNKGNVALGFGWTGFVKPAEMLAFFGQFICAGNYMNTAPRLSASSQGFTS